MLSNDIKILITSAIESFSTTPLTQSLIDTGVLKLEEAKELILNQDNGGEEEVLYKVLLVHPYTYTDYISDSYPNASTGAITTQTKYKASNYLDIENMKFISIHENTSYHICCFYDTDKNFIIGYNTNQYTKDSQLEVPKGAKYVVVGSASNGKLPVVYGYTTIKPQEVVFEHESNFEYTVSNVAVMKQGDYKTGDTVTTECYATTGDLGNGVYDIMSEDEYLSRIKGSAFIVNATTQVDGYGDHLLDNGLVARLRINHDDMRPEQWGAKGDGVTNDCLPLVHMFAKITSGTVTFRENATYVLGLVGGDVSNPSDNPYRTFGCGSLLGGQFFSKPIMIGAHNFTMNGNNCLITIPDNTFGNTGMGILNFSGHMENVEIYGFNFDGKGRTINYPNKNSNHIIFWAPIGIAESESIKAIHPVYTKNEKTSCIENWSIHDNYFYDAGAMYKKAGDWGGDHILIINPTETDGLYVENNKFEAWGRWVFAIDLGGHGECLHNIKFNNNNCIGANGYLESDADGNFTFLLDDSKVRDAYVYTGSPAAYIGSFIDRWRWRALGLIDFEAKKCFDNVEFKDNYIIGSSGWAINGNSRVSQNFLIKNNFWRHVGGGYPYFFELYSGMGKDIVVEDNKFTGSCGFKCGYFSENLTFKRNYGLRGLRTFGIAGNITLEDNKSLVDSPNYMGILWSHESNNYATDPLYTYEKVKEIGVHVTIKNSEGALTCKFSEPTNTTLNDFFTFDLDLSPIQRASIYDFNHLFEFDPNNIDFINQVIRFYGARFTKPFENSIMGGSLAYYKAGEMIATNCQKWGVVGGDLYKNKLIPEEEFTIYNGCNWACYANRNGYSKLSIVCEEEGYLAGACQYGFREQCTHMSYVINNSLTLQDTAFVCTDDNVYYVSGQGKLTEIPTHTEGSREFTDANGNVLTLYYIGKVAKVKLICE